MILHDTDSKGTIQERIMFRNDLAISNSEIESKEISFPIQKTDTTIICKFQYTIPENDKSEKRDTILTETFYYDFKNILNYPVLVLKYINYKDIDGNYLTAVLTCSDENAEIKETSNLLKPVNFKIGGYGIGDSININLLTDIKDCYICDCEGIINAKLKQNEDINFQIIDKKYIYRIEQTGINEDTIENIAKEINQKLNLKPEKPMFAEGYRWRTSEILIVLFKDIFDDEFITPNDENSKAIIQNDGYTLVYDNNLIQTVLKFKQDKKTESFLW